MEVHVLLADAYESLCVGYPVYEVYCPACKSVLLPIPLRQTGQLTKPSSIKCACVLYLSSVEASRVHFLGITMYNELLTMPLASS